MKKQLTYGQSLALQIVIGSRLLDETQDLHNVALEYLETGVLSPAIMGVMEICAGETVARVKRKRIAQKRILEVTEMVITELGLENNDE